MELLQAASKHRQAVLDLSKLAMADTLGAVRLLKDQPLRDFAGELRKTLPTIVKTYGSASALLSTTFYDQSRLQAKAKGQFKAKAASVNLDVLDSGIGYSIAQTVNGSSLDVIESTLTGVVARAVAGVDRETIFDNSQRDPQATYRRVASLNACAFCLTMAAVAEVQYTEDAASFHDHCSCVNVPVFSGQRFSEPRIYDTVRQHYNDAVSEIQVKRELVGYNSMKARDAARAHPDLTLTTPNILKIVRETTGLR
jgi:hypothetical protein